MEKDLAARLSAFAVENAEALGVKTASVAVATRYLLRIGLGVPQDIAVSAEHSRKRPCDPTFLSGIRLDQEIVDGINRGTGLLRDTHGILTHAGSARHLIRLGLGYGRDVSLEIEDRFLAISEARRRE
jgi:hypothetical protein